MSNLNEEFGGGPPLPRLTILDVLESNARHRAEKVALIDAHVSLTYRQVWQRVLSDGQMLREHGVARGTVVALAMDPSVAFVTSVLAVMAAGGVAAPINTRLAVGEVARYVETLGASLTITDPANADFLTLNGEGLLVDPAEPKTAESSSPLDWTTVTADDPAIIFPTGGTTGIPKGAVHLHGGVFSYCSMQGLNGFKTTDDLELCISPMFHVAFLSGPLTLLFMGATGIIKSRFDSDQVADLIYRQPVTTIFGTPVHFQSIMDSPQFRGSHSLRHLNTGGSNATTEQLRRMIESFPNAKLTSTYGATELGMVTMAMHEELVAGRVEGVGRPTPAVSIRVVDSSGRTLEEKSTGELLIRTPWQAVGYWRNPEETRATWIDGYVAIGDIGSLDDGWLTLHGRKKEMILSGGENVFPNEVENVLAQHPAIAQVAAFGCADERWGERVEVAIVLAEGHAEVDYEVLRDYFSGDLARYKFPKHIHVLDALPKTPVGKIDRRALRARYSQ